MIRRLKSHVNQALRGDSTLASPPGEEWQTRGAALEIGSETKPLTLKRIVPEMPMLV